MNRCLSLLFAFTLLSGCVSLQVKSSEAKLSTIRAIAVIPLEPPPLAGVSVSKGWGAELTSTAIRLSMIPDPNIQPGARALALVFGVAMLIEAAAAGAEKPEQSARLEDIPSQQRAWVPTLVLAEEARTQLTAKGARKVVPITKYYRLPVASQERTWHMENWLAPIRRWYNAELSAVEYTGLAEPVDAVLEIGLLNYELHGGLLVMQVMIKLIDPATKQVVGRARNAAFPDTGSLEELLKNDGRRFQQLFTETATKLVNKSLNDLGLLP